MLITHTSKIHNGKRGRIVGKKMNCSTVENLVLLILITVREINEIEIGVNSSVK